MENIKKITYSYIEYIGNKKFIEIDINKNSILLFNNYDKKKIKLGNEKMIEFVDNILSIVIHWKDENIKNNIIDGFEIKLLINTCEKEEIKYFKNIIPSNFDLFNKLINEVLV